MRSARSVPTSSTSRSAISAARAEFKHLEYFYFHNFPYERLWKDNRRRYGETMPTWKLLHTFNPDYRVVFVGDAMEEPIDRLCAIAGELGLLGVPVFTFQEGHDPEAERLPQPQ